MPKVGCVVNGPFDPPMTSEHFISSSDLSVGVRISLAGHLFFIYDADAFTRDYYKTEMGTELAPKLDVMLPEDEAPRAPTPPYTGYGSWDDSMSSVLHLVPKVPRKDFVKLFNNDGKILRFTAKFVDPKPEDVDR